MAPTTAVSTAYAFRIHGDPTTPAAKAKALAGGGQLLIAKDHKLAALLPDALDATSKAPDVLVRTADVDGSFIAGALLAPDLAESGVHFTLDIVRSAMVSRGRREVKENMLIKQLQVSFLIQTRVSRR